ncbi:MAG: glycosyltransferase family 4 protein [Candidatus Woesearchaeota archaeon]
MIVREYHKYGGISKVVAEISERLVNLGHEVHIYTSRWNNTYDNNIIFHKVPILNLDFLGNVVPRKINKLIKGISFLFFSKFSINTKAYDIIHIHGDSLVKADVVTAHSCHKEWLEISKKFVKNPVDWILKNLNPHHWRILFTEKINYRKVYKPVFVKKLSFLFVKFFLFSI